jgi:hypothetical protein
MAELVDALVSGISDRKVVEVRVFFWAPSQQNSIAALLAQVAELVDALVSGISDRKVVEVRVFSWAPSK